MKTCIALIVCCLSLAACVSAFPEKSEAEKKEEWWDGYYGRPSESDCDFYGNCKSAKKSGGGWW